MFNPALSTASSALSIDKSDSLVSFLGSDSLTSFVSDCPTLCSNSPYAFAISSGDLNFSGNHSGLFVLDSSIGLSDVSSVGFISTCSTI